MGGMCRKYLYKIFNSSVCSNPFLFGVLAGIVLNLAFNDQPLDEELVDGLMEKEDGGSLLDRLETNINILKDVQQQDSYVRPRFIRDEINISSSIFVGVLLGEGVSKNYMKYYNVTTRHYVEKTIVFAEKNSSFKNEKNLVSLKECNFMQAIKHIGENYRNFHFYYIIQSDSLVNGLALSEIVHKLKFENEVLIGKKSSAKSKFCDTTKGILLNNNVLNKILNRSENFKDIGCDPETYDVSYNAVASDNLGELKGIAPGMIYNLKSEQSYRDAALEILESQTRGLQAALTDLEDDMETFIDESDYLEAEWPVVVYKPKVEPTRFDNEVYDYIYDGQLVPTEQETSSIYARERETEAIKTMAEKCLPNQQSRVVSGWRKVEPDSGVKILLNLEYPGEEDKPVRTDCSVYQEFSNPLMVSLPFVTESTKISLVVPVSESDSKSVLTFLKSFAKTCLERNDRVFLMLVFLYTRERPDKNNNKDFYKEVKQTALQLSKKYKKKDKGSSILWYSMQLKDGIPTPVETMDLLTQKLDSKSIILMGSPNMEVHSDYLNRVRMNTIEGRLAFSPIPFTEFHPQVTAKGQTSSVSFNSSTGHFDVFDFQHVSFFKSDYLNLRQYIETPLTLKEDDLSNRTQMKSLPWEMFRIPAMFQQYGHLRNKNEEDSDSVGKSLHVIRAPEPSLRLRYSSVICEPSLPSKVYAECLERRKMSLGSRAHLANIFLRNQNL